jgi:N,N-dimethylformamidase beta subunit-like protein
VMVGYKNGSIDPYAKDPDPVKRQQTTVLWRDEFLNRPEQRLIGVQFSGQVDTNEPYVVTNSSSWVYQGTGLTDGYSIPGLVGYEADSSMPGVPPPTAAIDPATGQSTYQVLSRSPYTDVAGGPQLEGNSSIYQAPSGAWVFGAGTISWSWGLDLPGVVNWRIQRTTANLLNRFLGISSPPIDAFDVTP